jgi:hypothetical protein
VRRREGARGEKTAEDQGVPWRKTRVWGGGEVVPVIVGGEERSVYFMCQSAWWKVCGRLRGEGIFGRSVGLGCLVFGAVVVFGVHRQVVL